MAEWQQWIFAVLVAASVIVALVVRQRLPRLRADLPAYHVAAATIIGLTAWDWLLQLPGTIAEFIGMTAGMDGFQGRSALEVFTAATIVVTIAAVAATIGILRRAPWGIALGIGVCVSFIATQVMGLIVFLDASGGFVDDANVRSYVAFAVGRIVPPIAAIVLLVAPLRSGERSDQRLEAGLRDNQPTT